MSSNSDAFGQGCGCVLGVIAALVVVGALLFGGLFAASKAVCPSCVGSGNGVLWGKCSACGGSGWKK